MHIYRKGSPWKQEEWGWQWHRNAENAGLSLLCKTDL